MTETYLPLSYLNAWEYCPRRFYLEYEYRGFYIEFLFLLTESPQGD